MAKDTTKDTIYVDVDDEITAIIDKVSSSPHKIVALVLPKRAVVLQSIVNMKLLKSTADEAKKHLVLITSETGLMPLAGAVGVLVAKSPQSKPSVPPATQMNDDIPEDVGDELAEQEEVEDFNAATSKNRSIGELAAAQASDESAEADESIELGDDEDEDDTDAADKSSESKKDKKAEKPDKKLKVPNFNKFRLWIVLGCLALVLIVVGSIFAFVILPKATIAITTDSRNVPVSETITASTKAQAVDQSGDTIVVPAKSAQQTKTQVQQVDATGKKNVGKTATGSVKMSVCTTGFNNPDSVPAGTGISAGGKTYITQETAQFVPQGGNGSCFVYRSSSVDIEAQNAGESYNVGSSTDFSVAGRSDVSASGSASGGSDQFVTVVSQGDVDGAKKKIEESPDTTALKDQLKNNLASDGWQPVVESFNADDGKVTLSAEVGDEADNVTVTQVTTYTMVGVKQADLSSIITADVKEQIKGDKQQNILSDGAQDANFTVLSNADPNNVQLTMSATAEVGPKLDENEIKKMAVGKKTGDIKKELEKIDGVKSVDVSYSPFWVSKVPGKTSKVTVVFKQSGK